MTFKNARELQDFAPEIPAERLLVGTDSPFLAPCRIAGRLRASLSSPTPLDLLRNYAVKRLKY